MAAVQSSGAALIIIGNEILSGRTRDANLPFLAGRLGDLGIPLLEVRVVADAPQAIIEAVNACRRRYRYVFTTGGIGPTHDDITTDCVGRAFGVEVREHPEAARRLRAFYGPQKLNPARLRMARIPVGAVLIDNPVSAAPGFQLDNVFVLAGVPSIMQVMFEGVVNRLQGGPPIRSRTVVTDRREGDLAEGLGRVQAHYPQVCIGSYPYFHLGAPGVNLVLRSTDEPALTAARAEVLALIQGLGGSAAVDEEPGGCDPV